MNTTKKYLLLTILLMFGVPLIHAQSNMLLYDNNQTSSEKVIGTVSGEVNAGRCYELYVKSSIWSGYKHDGWRDKRKDYSYNELYEICLSHAKRKYGDSYPNLYLKDFIYSIDENEQPDEHAYSQVIGDEEEYKLKDIIQRTYRYSATVVVAE